MRSLRRWGFPRSVGRMAGQDTGCAPTPITWGAATFPSSAGTENVRRTDGTGRSRRPDGRTSTPSGRRDSWPVEPTKVLQGCVAPTTHTTTRPFFEIRTGTAWKPCATSPRVDPGAAALPHPDDLDARHASRDRPGLLDADEHRGDARKLEAAGGEPVGEGFDEVDVILRERVRESGERRVVDGLREVVRGKVRALHLKLDRNDEGLGQTFLVREVADMRFDREIAKEHSVPSRHRAHGPLSFPGLPVSGLSGSKA